MKIAEDVYIAEGAKLIGDVTIQPGSSVWFNSVLRADINYIKIGKNTNIQDLSCLHVADNHYVEIGDDCVIGHNVVLHGAIVGNRVLVGMGAIILDGAVIGDDCMIGAGSLILERTVIPPNSLVVGSPARVKRMLTDQEKKYIVDIAEKYKLAAKTYKDKDGKL